eukprot:CAMPEP_0185158804 /NCGR_PEP_ID=MMETSP1139-20130426/2641_1 /TAXON_ID=298111 /ORGANISM="Pavlova sp., Strain CCMP459" /LENGTH=69 /DNA_ID=CAMNT_0027723953 /DNA_START=294 /DNA_END=503 /DNA_ORIENTATION=-
MSLAMSGTEPRGGVHASGGTRRAVGAGAGARTGATDLAARLQSPMTVVMPLSLRLEMSSAKNLTRRGQS